MKIIPRRIINSKCFGWWCCALLLVWYYYATNLHRNCAFRLLWLFLFMNIISNFNSFPVQRVSVWRKQKRKKSIQNIRIRWWRSQRRACEDVQQLIHFNFNISILIQFTFLIVQSVSQSVDDESESPSRTVPAQPRKATFRLRLHGRREKTDSRDG